ncbi:hypothetical protein H4F73_17185 [Enterobacter hormaechei]|uniref:hypothetical protein n=1 Tax=Enterobacter hormaechei TaxID=158836 RepID=UPI00197F8D19|nr:hypothetical protein [Enterobacter hormaechei]MBN4796787.1 hypothetical protein [Enterobacter hormaechei]MBN4820875.1 hypothetical protein [Enterobacter hormaechei]
MKKMIAFDEMLNKYLEDSKFREYWESHKDDEVEGEIVPVLGVRKGKVVYGKPIKLK